MTQPLAAQLLSVNVGLPREVLWKGRPVLTGIFKEPVTGSIIARRLDLDGDQQLVARSWGRVIARLSTRTPVCYACQSLMRVRFLTSRSRSRLLVIGLPVAAGRAK